MDAVTSNKMFSQLLYYLLQRYHKSMKSELKLKAESLIEKRNCSFVIDNDSVGEYTRIASVNLRNVPASMEGIQTAVDLVVKKLVPFDAGSGNFTRTYQSMSDQNKLHVVCEHTLSSDNVRSIFHREHECLAPSMAMTKLRYCKPDLRVIFGNDDGTKEFRCYSVLLSFACSKLDFMVHKSPKRLLLPNLNPDENTANLTPMLPFFTEFEMYNHLEASVNVIQRSHCEMNSFDEEPPVCTIIALLKCVFAKGLKNVQHLFQGLYELGHLNCGLG
eukprot:scaffold15073_cov72-Cyclotella_meneghiniana.AAC.9